MSVPGFVVVWWAWRSLGPAETALAFYLTINGAQFLPMALGVLISLRRLAELDEDEATDNMALKYHHVFGFHP